MQLAHIEELPDYLEWLREEPAEVHALADDFLITVTNFFRDPEVAERLEQEVVPQLFEGKGWARPCASGQSAARPARRRTRWRCCSWKRRPGTKPRPRSRFSPRTSTSIRFEKRVRASTPATSRRDVSAERLRRFFIKENGGYRIRKEVREQVVFAPHNLLGDPPFSKLDLITCRNVLIYLQRGVQRDVLDLFHYALNPDGFLVLGTSETVDRSELFRTESKLHCIFRKRNVPAPEPQLPVFPHHARPRARRAGGAERPDG